jgi:hypothetical protein
LSKFNRNEVVARSLQPDSAQRNRRPTLSIAGDPLDHVVKRALRLRTPGGGAKVEKVAGEDLSAELEVSRCAHRRCARGRGPEFLSPEVA